MFQVLHLTQNMRLIALQQDANASTEELQFPSFLIKVGENRAPDTTEDDRVRLPVSVHVSSDIRELCYKVFHGMELNYADTGWVSKRAVLTTKNVYLEEINMIVGALIPGHLTTFKSADSVQREDGTQEEIVEEGAEGAEGAQATEAADPEPDEDEILPQGPAPPAAAEAANDEAQQEHGGEAPELSYPVEVLNTLSAGSALPDHELKLKKNFIVMLLRNLNPMHGHVNGARYQVVRMSNTLLILKSITGVHSGKILALPRMPCSPGDENFPIKGFVRTQFPVRVCFGLTTNKAQGSSFSGALGLDFRDDCFSHGQLYVALSRTTNPANVSVLLKSDDRRAKNVVYPEALR